MQSRLSYRPISANIDALIGHSFPVLDHGFVRVVDYMGNDDAIDEAARVSYGGGTRSTTDTRGLIHYLMRHRHTTPFEMCELKVQVKLPIFVARQWVRHRTASINEISARYSVLDNEFYIPASENLAKQSTENKQGRGEAYGAWEARAIQRLLREAAGDARAGYENLLELDLARELARLNLSLNFYTQWFWKVDLHNLMHFLQLRADPHAQYEIRAYADVLLNIVETWCPIAHEAFLEHRLNAKTFSATAVGVLKRMLAGETVDQETSGLSRREWREFSEALSLPTPEK